MCYKISNWQFAWQVIYMTPNIKRWQTWEMITQCRHLHKMKKENNESPIEGRGFSGLSLYLAVLIFWIFHYQILTEIEHNSAFTVNERNFWKCNLIIFMNRIITSIYNCLIKDFFPFCKHIHICSWIWIVCTNLSHINLSIEFLGYLWTQLCVFILMRPLPQFFCCTVYLYLFPKEPWHTS